MALAGSTDGVSAVFLDVASLPPPAGMRPYPESVLSCLRPPVPGPNRESGPEEFMTNTARVAAIAMPPTNPIAAAPKRRPLSRSVWFAGFGRGLGEVAGDGYAGGASKENCSKSPSVHLDSCWLWS